MSLQSLLGLGLESQRSSTIGSDEWLLNTIALCSSFLAGPSTGRAAAGVLRPQMNFLTPLSFGLEIQIHGSERPANKIGGDGALNVTDGYPNGLLCSKAHRGTKLQYAS
jgi:hypothetical protein